MRKATKIWLIAAMLLIFVGSLIFVGALAAVDFDFSRLSTQKLEKSTYELNGDFEHISVNTETATLTFVPSNEVVCRVECTEETNMKHSVEIRDGTLFVSVVNNRKWYDYIGISFRAPTVTIYLPQSVYLSLSVQTKTGNVEIPESLSFGSVYITGTTSNISCHADVSTGMELHTTTGNITVGSSKPSKTEIVTLFATTGRVAVKDISCNELVAKTVTGHIELEHVIAVQGMKVENTTGGVRFDGCDAGDITVQTSTGNVTGTLLSEKIFVTDTSTGRVRVPRTTGGGKCEITTSTGDIEIEIGS